MLSPPPPLKTHITLKANFFFPQDFLAIELGIYYFLLQTPNNSCLVQVATLIHRYHPLPYSHSGHNDHRHDVFFIGSTISTIMEVKLIQKLNKSYDSFFLSKLCLCSYFILQLNVNVLKMLDKLAEFWTSESLIFLRGGGCGKDKIP